MFFDDSDDVLMIPISKAFIKEGEELTRRRDEFISNNKSKLLLYGYTPKNTRGPFVLDEWLKTRGVTNTQV